MALFSGGSDPLWYKDAVMYEVHVRSFCDGNGDGIGDFGGLASKLDYIRDLGATTVWLLPFYPSPLKDDGYDIACYTDVHPAYGTLEDFKRFLEEAHARGIRVLVELVLNHTSDQHPWFQRARRAPPGSPERDFYVWSNTTERFQDARIVFQDFETSNWTWDPVARAYYWHRFFSHQPDLNYENPEVIAAIDGVLEFWFGLGVDGMRLDAVPYLAEAEGTPSENLKRTHAILKHLRHEVDSRHAGKVLLAEANQWPQEAAAYFGNGEECQMAFHFPLMPRLFLSVRQEDRFPIVDIFSQTPPIPENCQWGLFLRNHDELTLEMVTEEERAYMYLAYAQKDEARLNLGIRRRLAPLLNNNRRQIELMNLLLFTLPGTPIIYYGDEIGMGDNIYLGDRQGVRTPMQWGPDRNAGFSRCHPQQLYLPLIIDHEYHYETVHVEAQQRNPYSLLSWMKRLIELRKRFKALGRGSIQFLAPENQKILAFIRSYQGQYLLVVVNLSRFAQPVHLDLRPWAGRIPRDLFGGSDFPTITEKPFFLSLAPQTSMVFLLQRSSRPLGVDSKVAITVQGRWQEVLNGDSRREIEDHLRIHLQQTSSLKNRANEIVSLRILESAELPGTKSQGAVILVKVQYTQGEPGLFLMPLAFRVAKRPSRRTKPTTDIADLRVRTEHRTVYGVLYDGLREPRIARALLRNILSGHLGGSTDGQFTSRSVSSLLPQPAVAEKLPVKVVEHEQTNTTLLFGRNLALKLFRNFESGPNPEIEIGTMLTHCGVSFAPRLLAALEYQPLQGISAVAGALYSYVAHEEDGWQCAGRAFRQFLTRAQRESRAPRTSFAPAGLLECSANPIPPSVKEMLGWFLPMSQQIGRTTAEMHRVLSSASGPGFAPEQFTYWYRQSLFQRMRLRALHLAQRLNSPNNSLPRGARPLAKRVLRTLPILLHHFRTLLNNKAPGIRIRCHGNYHLGQILRNKEAFVIIDFEGEPTRPLFERRLKQSSLSDLASMLRSFRYAAHAGVREYRHKTRESDLGRLRRWGEWWAFWAGAAFLQAYFDSLTPVATLTTDREQSIPLLEAFLLERTIFELNNGMRKGSLDGTAILRDLLQAIPDQP